MFFRDMGFTDSLLKQLNLQFIQLKELSSYAISLYYFIELFKKPLNLNLKNESGVLDIRWSFLFFSHGTLPYLCLENLINRNYYEIVLTHSIDLLHFLYTSFSNDNSGILMQTGKNDIIIFLLVTTISFCCLQGSSSCLSIYIRKNN
jgi:hypothetical protein